MRITKNKASSVRHTRAIQRDRTKRPLSAPPDEQITARLIEVVHPATLQLISYYHQLGLRERLLTLPVMVALVLILLCQITHQTSLSELPSVGGVDSGLTFPMAYLHLSQDLLQGGIPPG